MKTGIELITQEREEQITKHGFTNDYTYEHPQYYQHEQLTVAATAMLDDVPDIKKFPRSWDNLTMIEKMAAKPYIERLAIAGALLAAEIDRVHDLFDRADNMELSEDNYSEFMELLDSVFDYQYPNQGLEKYSETLSQEQWLLDYHGATVQNIIDGEVECWED